MKDLFESDKIYTIGDVAEVLRVSQVTVVRAIHKGRLKALRIEGQWRILGGDILGYLREERERALSDHAWEP
jgi:excisionase family DNA binding protein